VGLAERVTQLVQAGNPPEIVNGANTSASILYAAFDLLEPIDNVLTTVLDRYGEPPDWTLYQNNDGNELFIPGWSAVSALWYRPDLNEAAGLSADFKPDTWEKLIQYERETNKLDEVNHGTYMPAAGNAGNSTLEFTMWLRQAGGRYTKHDGENWVAAFDEGDDRSAMIDALNFCKEQYQFSPDAGNSTWTDIGHSIETGVSASVCYTGARPKNYAINNDREFASDITTVSGPMGETPKTRAQNTPFLVFQDSNTEAAKKFLEFLTREEYFAELHWLTAEVHNAPAYPGLSNSDKYQQYLDDTPEWKPEQYGIYFDEQQQNGFVNPFESDPANPYWAVTAQSLIISEMVYDVLVNENDPDSVIDGYASELTEALIERKEQSQ
jgi:ABC-type glycerol-3-phosphate transport system substrate-binding protein